MATIATLTEEIANYKAIIAAKTLELREMSATTAHLEVETAAISALVQAKKVGLQQFTQAANDLQKVWDVNLWHHMRGVCVNTMKSIATAETVKEATELSINATLMMTLCHTMRANSTADTINEAGIEAMLEFEEIIRRVQTVSLDPELAMHIKKLDT